MIHRREGWLRVIWGHCLGNAGPRGLLGRVQRTWPLTMLAGRVVDSSSRWGAQGPKKAAKGWGLRADAEGVGAEQVGGDGVTQGPGRTGAGDGGLEPPQTASHSARM